MTAPEQDKTTPDAGAGAAVYGAPARVARRYAKAFVEALEEAGKLDDYQTFVDFAKIASGHPELRGVLANPGISPDAKLALMASLAERAALPKLVRSFLEVLARNRRLDILPALAPCVRREVDRLRNIQSVTLTTATPPTEAEVALFQERMSGVLDAEVRVATVVDPDILGGAIAQVGSTVYDGSVRGQLGRLRRDLVKER